MIDAAASHGAKLEAMQIVCSCCSEFSRFALLAAAEFAMPDVASRLRIAFVEHRADYRMNLQFCCDHYRSVSEVCRRLKINRQQFNRYLMGSATPSRHNHKLISDFFGLEEDELFGPHAAFAATFKRRMAAQDAPAVLRHHAALLRAVSGASGPRRRGPGARAQLPVRQPHHRGVLIVLVDHAGRPFRLRNESPRRRLGARHGGPDVRRRGRSRPRPH